MVPAHPSRQIGGSQGGHICPSGEGLVLSFLVRRSRRDSIDPGSLLPPGERFSLPLLSRYVDMPRSGSFGSGGDRKRSLKSERRRIGRTAHEQSHFETVHPGAECII